MKTQDMAAFAKSLDGKLTQDELDVMNRVFENIYSEAKKMGAEVSRLKSKVNRLAADNRELRSELSESREPHGVLVRLFGV